MWEYIAWMFAAFFMGLSVGYIGSSQQEHDKLDRLIQILEDGED